MADNSIRVRWMRDDLPVMNDQDVNIWINYISSTSGRNYQWILDSLERVKSDNVGHQVRLQNLDLITERLKKLTIKKTLGTMLDNKQKVLATQDSYEKMTGQTGDRNLGPVKNILGYAGIKTAGKKRTLKKRKRTVKRKHYRV